MKFKIQIRRKGSKQHRNYKELLYAKPVVAVQVAEKGARRKATQYRRSLRVCLERSNARLCMVKPNFDCMRELQDDAAFYQTVLRMKRGFSSAATLHQRMDAIGITKRERVLTFNTHLLKSNGIEPMSLKKDLVSKDIDVTPIDYSNTQ